MKTTPFINFTTIYTAFYKKSPLKWRPFVLAPLSFSFDFPNTQSGWLVSWINVLQWIQWITLEAVTLYLSENWFDCRMLDDIYVTAAKRQLVSTCLKTALLLHPHREAHWRSCQEPGLLKSNRSIELGNLDADQRSSGLAISMGGSFKPARQSFRGRQRRHLLSLENK